MRRIFLTAALASGALLGTPRASSASCLTESVESCNADFPASQKELVAIRGWCYLIRSGICYAFD